MEFYIFKHFSPKSKVIALNLILKYLKTLLMKIWIFTGMSCYSIYIYVTALLSKHDCSTRIYMTALLEYIDRFQGGSVNTFLRDDR